MLTNGILGELDHCSIIPPTIKQKLDMLQVAIRFNICYHLQVYSQVIIINQSTLSKEGDGNGQRDNPYGKLTKEWFNYALFYDFVLA